MTSRERVVTSLNHRTPDHIPVDFSGHRSSGIAGIAYARLRDYLGLPNRPIRIYDPIQQIAIVDEDVLDLFKIDTIELGRGFALEDKDWRDWVLPDGTPCQLPAWIRPERDGKRWVIRSRSGRVIAQMPGEALYFEQTYHPFAQGEPDPTRIREAQDECMWTSMDSPLARSPPARAAANGSSPAPGGFGNRQTGPSSDSLVVISSRWASSSTGTTTSL